MQRWFLLAFALALPACSGSGKAPTKAPEDAPFSRRLHPNEVFPADLDVVVRIDLERVKAALGPTAEKDLGARFSGDPLLSRAIQRGRAVTVGVRAADFDHGDHVIVVEGDVQGLDPRENGLEQQPSANAKVRIFGRGGPAARDSTGTVVMLDDRAIAFVSPVESDAVLRILREGADDLRGQPVAEGVVSADVRPRRLPPALERKYRSIGRIIAQVARIKALLSVGDGGLVLEGEIIARGEPGAELIQKFLLAAQSAAADEGPSAILKTAVLDRFGVVVRVKAVIPVEILLNLVAPSPSPSDTPANP